MPRVAIEVTRGHRLADRELQEVLDVVRHRLRELHVARARALGLVDRELDGVGVAALRRQRGRHRFRSEVARGVLGDAHVRARQRCLTAVWHDHGGRGARPEHERARARAAAIGDGASDHHLLRLPRAERHFTHLGVELGEHHVGRALECARQGLERALAGQVTRRRERHAHRAAAVDCEVERAIALLFVLPSPGSPATEMRTSAIGCAAPSMTRPRTMANRCLSIAPGCTPVCVRVGAVVDEPEARREVAGHRAIERRRERGIDAPAVVERGTCDRPLTAPPPSGNGASPTSRRCPQPTRASSATQVTTERMRRTDDEARANRMKLQVKQGTTAGLFHPRPSTTAYHPDFDQAFTPRGERLPGTIEAES